MDKYICDVCGYIYDPEAGDPDGGIAPGTAFEDIPDDWVCPVCGVSKDNFSLYTEQFFLTKDLIKCVLNAIAITPSAAKKGLAFVQVPTFISDKR